MIEVSVPLGKRAYSIMIEPGMLTRAHTWLASHYYHEWVVVTDENIAPLYLDAFVSHLSGQRIVTIVLPSGEKSKSIDNWLLVLNKMLEAKVSRGACLVALGGGVVGDLGGFAAACYQRGIDFLQIPTTLLAMVDSSVGGKTAVNHPLGKNMIGAFYQPKNVIVDLNVLATLPAREYAAGLAEILKYGLIWDEYFFELLEQEQDAIKHRQLDVLGRIIARCCEIKGEVVALDEQEHNVRAILNFGHTFAHGIEAVTDYQRYLHGEAVAIGMCMALALGVALKELPTSLLERTQQWLRMMGLPITLDDDIDPQAVWHAMQWDKKKTSKGLRFVLLDRLGKALVRDDIDVEIAKSVLY